VVKSTIGNPFDTSKDLLSRSFRVSSAVLADKDASLKLGLKWVRCRKGLSGRVEGGVLGLGSEESPTPMLAFGAADGQVHLVAAAQGGRRPRLRTKHAMEVSCVAISSDGRFLSAGCRDRSWKLWDGVSGAEVAWARGHDSEGLCTCQPQLVQGDFMIDPRCPVEGHSGAVSSMVFSPGGSRIATGQRPSMLAPDTGFLALIMPKARPPESGFGRV